MNYLNTQTTSANRPGNNLTPEMKTYYDRALIRFASPKLVHAQFGQQKPIPAGSGKTIEFRRFSPLPKALTPLTRGRDAKGQHPECDHGGVHGGAVRRLYHHVGYADPVRGGFRDQRDPDRAGRPGRPNPGHSDPGKGQRGNQRTVRAAARRTGTCWWAARPTMGTTTISRWPL